MSERESGQQTKLQFDSLFDCEHADRQLGQSFIVFFVFSVRRRVLAGLIVLCGNSKGTSSTVLFCLKIKLISVVVNAALVSQAPA